MYSVHVDAQITSLSGVTSTHDQSLESSQSEWSTKFCKLFWRVADQHKQILFKFFH